MIRNVSIVMSIVMKTYSLSQIHHRKLQPSSVIDYGIPVYSSFSKGTSEIC